MATKKAPKPKVNPATHPFRVVRASDGQGDYGQHKSVEAARKRISRLVKMSNGAKTAEWYDIVNDLEPPSPPTTNEQFLDSLIRHQVYLQRLSGAITNDMNRVLDASEDDLERQIQKRLAGAKGFTTQTLKRLNVLKGVVSSIRGGAWKEATAGWMNQLRQLAGYEPEFTARAIQTAAPVLVDMVQPSPEQLNSIVKSRPMEGRTLGEWAARQRSADIDRISQAVQIGMVQGESSAQIAARVVGTQQNRKTDGVTQITRNEAAALTRTAVNFVSNEARTDMLQANSDIIQEEQYVATLDSRTTAVCRAYDGKRYPLGEGPKTPQHFQCRSTRVAVIDGEVLGQRPAKPATEKMLVREYAEKQGLEGVKKRDDLPRGHKGEYDKFARRRVRELTGPVPAKLTYDEWLRQQSREFQDDVLGPARGKLFREGMKLDKFVSRSGDELTLAQIGAREGVPAGARPRAPVSLSEADKKHIREYQNGAAINGYLRDLADPNRPDFSKAIAKRGIEQLGGQLDALDRATKMDVFPEDVVLYRGVNKALLGIPAEGKTFVDPAFVATSLDPEVAAGFGRVMMIKVPAGSTMLDVNKALGKETRYEYQKEYILPRDSKFKVLVDKEGSLVLELVNE